MRLETPQLVRRFAVLAIAFASSGACLAGPLNPPSGPIAPTGKTTQEVFDKAAAAEPRTAINAANTPGDAEAVFVITAPGSYVLPSDIVTPFAGNKHAIKVSANDVTIDLNGFIIQGYLGSLDGVHASTATIDNLTVKNGTVRAVGGVGIFAPGSQCRIEDVSALQCSLAGIYVGDGARLSRCTAIGSGNTGIHAAKRSIITQCSASGVSTGIDADESCVVSGCVVHTVSSYGILASCGSTVTGCSVRAAADDGIAGCGCTVVDCSVVSGGGDGISVGGASHISKCTVSACQNGINCFSSCLVSDNLVVSNALAGILLTEGHNRVEGNNCVTNGVGIRCDHSGNLIIRNSSTGSTNNYVFVANNRYGPIINVVGGSTPAVSGNSAPSSLTTTDPAANICY